MERVPVHPALFTADGGALLGARCPDCARWQFPAAADCPYCGGAACAAQPLGRRGTLYLFTAVHARPPGYHGALPFGLGVVELPEGLRVIARLTECDPARLTPGMPVQLVVVPLHVDDAGREVVSYAFAPAADGAS